VLTGRRTGAAVASSGLAVSLLAVPASAAPTATDGSSSLIDTAALTAAARALVTAAPAAAAPAEATWVFDVPTATAVVPPPPAPVVEEPAEEPAADTASRSQQRQAPAELESEPDPAAVGAPVPASANGSALVEIASSLVGIPYVYGGTTPSGFDCSGFTSYVYAQAGMTIPRTSTAQRDAGTVVSRDQAQPGDLIWSPGHIAIYAGGNLQVDAPVPGKTIQIREIWQSNPTFIRIG
jgi:cell wall-associated NlpC family hydrolase